jgi:hypothetical protein
MSAPPLTALSLPELARLFGADAGAIGPATQAAFSQDDFRYRRLAPAERDQVMLRILSRLDANAFAKAGQQRKAVWEAAWSAQARQFAAGGGLTPNYIDVDAVIRLDGEYAQPAQPNFENSFSSLFRPWLFERFFSGARAIFEFGCGSGFNLVTLSSLFPGTPLFGLDWAAPAVDLVNAVATAQGLNLRGLPFDFFAPDPALQLPAGSAVLTSCALEQVGDRHEAFTRFLLDRAPSICLHMEPLAELYDPASLPDYLALRYHRQRNYLDGFLTRLRQMEAEGSIEIVALHRVRFGNLYHEGYSYVAWKPAREGIP